MKNTLFLITTILLFTCFSCHSKKYDDDLVSKFFSDIDQLFNQIDEALEKRPYKRMRDIITEERKATFPECRNELITPVMEQNTWFKERVLPIQKKIVKKHREILKENLKQSDRDILNISAAIVEKTLEHYQLMTTKLDLINDETIKSNKEFMSRLSDLNVQDEQIEKEIGQLRKTLKDIEVRIRG